MILTHVQIAQSGPIKIVPYDRDWPNEFERARADLSADLSGISVKVYHVGSTAVPGLSAKPKIDIDLILACDDDLTEARMRMERTARIFHGNPYNDGMWTYTTINQIPGHRIYFCIANTTTHQNRILFRDYLRKDPEAAAMYDQLKRKLVIHSKGNWRNYTAGKSAFVSDIIDRAKNISLNP